MDRDRDPGIPRRVESEEGRTYGDGPDAIRTREGERDAKTEADGRARERIAGIREERGADVVSRRDSARWGPVWAGLITALATFLLLQLLALGIGLIDIAPGTAAGGWVPVIIGLIAFFVGGLVAGATSAVRGTGTGLLNGFLVWGLGTVSILVLSALGVGQVFGAPGNVVAQLNLLQGTTQEGVGVPGVDATQVAQTIRTGSLAAFFGLLLAALAAMLGGLLGGAADRRRRRT